MTLGLIASFLFSLIIAGMLYTDSFDLPAALGLTIGLNLMLWLAGPTITDWINRYFYKVTFLTPNELVLKYSDLAAFLQQISDTHRIPVPRIGIIPDRNPTAFTYGSTRSNARIILTEGIFEFLSPQEVRAVVAHEMGHIVHGDFMVMMVASTLLQCLYQIYVYFSRSRNKKNAGAMLGIIALLLYEISIYLIYFLSRTREYMADRFAAITTSPQDLSNALIKIAYGIIAVDDTNASKQLLESTRHLGIIDVKNAKHLGITAYITSHNTQKIAEAMLFDLVNPWARLLELTSTHPLTGKRIQALATYAQEATKPFAFHMLEMLQTHTVEYAKLRHGFIADILIMLFPWALGGLVAIFIHPVLFLVGLVFGSFVTLIYQYPKDPSAQTTVLDLMCDPYASPVRGRPVTLQGSIIGRGNPGYIFDEDMMYQDRTGMIFLDFQGRFGTISNIVLALGKFQKLLNIQSELIH
jgi:Zn-dependent protease with chaperone function